MYLSTGKLYLKFPISSVVNSLPANPEDKHSIPASGRSPGEGKGNPLQYSCLENPMDRGHWEFTVHGRSLKRVCHDLATKQQQQALFDYFYQGIELKLDLGTSL